MGSRTSERCDILQWCESIAHLWPISWTMTAVFSAEAPLRYLHCMRTAESGRAGRA